ncbi:trypsin-like peptidase domain-containing protein [Saccharopolyspora sp. TS4A08]|uniref:Trypsin-like peptidase domain-containing protein n=1 Tax=Saccharopolyspora ipomoeae TaxID=3042027 RepID=A0ABT6PY08_9PSEU|nr:trypsin-like peptidase domain-containing protein [Saccharopolyspora sp. TS4A08]MDI2032528.1 trypsin-like peptidase domain-containing protein [Saccharopolyspora sp. TS4A08]
MSDQPGTPAQGPDARRDSPAPGQQDSEPVHPWQGGTMTGRGVPADQFATPPAQHANGHSADRLAPRPLERPEVDPSQRHAFARPHGVSGSFDPDQHGLPVRGIEQAPPPADALVQAFGRPPSHGDGPLQRAPGEKPMTPETEPDPVLWRSDDQARSGDRDPWRDPAAGAILGPPAVPENQSDDDGERAAGPLLSAREVLFGRRVHPRALAILGVVALLVGVAGGFLGRITAEEGNPLVNPDVTLAEVDQGATDRPRGSVSQVAQRVVPAVVSIEVRIGGQGGSGSGVVIDGDGYVVTNNHVVSMAADTPNAQVSTVFHDGTRAPARVVGRDVKTDLAVLKVEVSNPTVAQLGDSDKLKVGDDVIAIGSPLGLAGTVTTGIVSSVHRPVRLAGEGTDTNAVIDAIQTDAAINPGNSGGALVDGTGAVVGINSAIRTLGSGGEGGSIGLGFAIPIDDVRRIAQELIRTGTVRHADLGVNAKSVSDGLADGAQVQNVQDGSSAAGGGMAEGDVIIKVGDRKVGSADELIVAVDRHQVGERVPVTVVRQGRELVLDVTLK